MIDDFKQGMRILAGAVTIITAGKGASAAGMTATAVCSLSMEPPRILVCLNRSGATFAALLATGQFCVNILSARQQALAEEFAGQTGKAGSAKFGGSAWEAGTSQSPRNLLALAAIRSSVHSMTMLETHAIVIGNVHDVLIGPEDAPLVYRDRTFGSFAPLA